MSTKSGLQAIRRAACLAAAALVVACVSDAPTIAPPGARLDRQMPPSGRVAVCHQAAGSPHIIEVAVQALPALLAQGDYVTTLLVSHDNAAPPDGIHFRRISDALSAARTGRLAREELTSAACRITIKVSADIYRGIVAGTPTADDEQYPLIVDVPDITLHGAMTMQLSGAGRATGVATDGAESILAPVDPLPVIAGASTPIIVANGHPGGSAGNGLVVEGFVFQSGHPIVTPGGQGVLGLRVTALTVRGSRFEAGFTESIDLRASDADIIQNHLAGTGGTCDICLAAPGHYRASGNVLLAGGIPGITIDGVVALPTPAGVEALTLPPTAELWAEVRNNEVRDHLRTPVGVGIRVDANADGLNGNGSSVHNTVHAVIQDNELVNNRFGLIVHGGFPGPGSTSDLDVTLGGNTIEQSCQVALLVSFSRHQTTLGLNQFLYLNNSTYTLSLNGNVDWSDAWYGHPAGFGNTLVVDGQVMPNGTRQFYSKTTCPGL